jgi:hypothetical protein
MVDRSFVARMSEAISRVLLNPAYRCAHVGYTTYRGRLLLPITAGKCAMEQEYGRLWLQILRAAHVRLGAGIMTQSPETACVRSGYLR